MIKILYYSKMLDNGGVEKMFIEWISNIQDDNIHIDVVTEKILSKEIELKIESLGSKVFTIDESKLGSPKAKKQLRNIIENGSYDIVHIHVMVTFQCWVLDTAKKCGVKVRIAHSHNVLTNEAKLVTRLIHKYDRKKLNHITTARFACGQEAGYSLYGKKSEFITMKNGVNIDLFQKNNLERVRVRKELGLDEATTIVGSVGRLDTQKNYC